MKVNINKMKRNVSQHNIISVKSKCKIFQDIFFSIIVQLISCKNFIVNNSIHSCVFFFFFSCTYFIRFFILVSANSLFDER